MGGGYLVGVGWGFDAVGCGVVKGCYMDEGRFGQ